MDAADRAAQQINTLLAEGFYPRPEEISIIIRTEYQELVQAAHDYLEEPQAYGEQAKRLDAALRKINGEA